MKRKKEAEREMIRIAVGRLGVTDLTPPGERDKPALELKGRAVDLIPVDGAASAVGTAGDLLSGAVDPVRAAREGGRGALHITSWTNVEDCEVRGPVSIANGAVQFVRSTVDGRWVDEGEIVHYSDGTTEASIVTVDDAAHVSANAALNRSNPYFEALATERLASGWNKRFGTHYQGAAVGDSREYEDAFLTSSVPGEPRVAVQITALHQDMMRARGIGGGLCRYELKGLRRAIHASISKKGADTGRRAVPVEVRRSTVLALVSPVPLGKVVRAQLEQASLPTGGFRAVWICAFREPAFPLF